MIQPRRVRALDAAMDRAITIEVEAKDREARKARWGERLALSRAREQ